LPSLYVPLGSSIGFTAFSVVAGVLAIGSCWSLSGWQALAISFTAIAYLVWEWWIHLGRRGAHSVTAIWLIGEDEWSVELVDGEKVSELQLVGGSFCHPLLVLFSLRSPAGQRFRLVVPRDATPADSFRRLRVVLNDPR